MSIGRCRKCRRPIRWLTLVPSGKACPVNPLPDADLGNVKILEDDIGRVCGHQEAAERRERGEDLYVHHRATCPIGRS